jgi:hypothetical protein
MPPRLGKSAISVCDISPRGVDAERRFATAAGVI